MGTEELWCSLHGGWYIDPKPWQHTGYCRPCWNKLVAWRGRQQRQGLPTGIAHYREAHGLEKCPKPRREGLTDCSVCLQRAREHGAFCRGCHSAYVQWSRKRRSIGAEATIDDFRHAVDSGSVAPRHEGEPHYGLVVRNV